MEELKLMMSQQAQQSKQQQEFIEANIKGQSQVYDALYTQAQTLKLITDSMGASSVIAGQQIAQIDEQQDEITETI
jgi:Skp family chaperone for outer membrane proteins